MKNYIVILQKFYDDVLGLDYYLKKDVDNDILNLLRKIKEKTWLIHNDLYSWNIMIDKNWKIYIIDFGRIKNLNK